MFPREFRKLMTCPGYINKHENPLREKWKEETFYFYNCKVEDFFNSENTKFQYTDENNKTRCVQLINYFNQDNFVKYQAAYNLAQDVLNGKQTIESLNLPREVTSRPELDQAKVEYCIKVSNSPEKINTVLVEIAKHDNDIGRKVKALIDNKQYKEKYQEALDPQDMHSFKKFLLRCWFFIIHSLKFISFQESFATAKENYRKDYAEFATKTFKGYISNNIQSVTTQL